MITSHIHLKNIKKDFKQGEVTLEVLKGISFSFEQGNTYAITGVSGAGKSTLLHIIGGLDTPTTGQVFFNDIDIATMRSEWRSDFFSNKLGLVFQQPYLLDELSVLENVMLKGLITGQSRKHCERKAYTLLKMVGLESKALNKPRQLSGGQQQRIAIIRALFNEPIFLLADEPTGNLDEKTGRELVDFLLECHATWGMGIMVSSHDEYVVRRMSTLINLHNGLLV